MLQTEAFTMRISPKEKLMLSRIAQHHERSQSDVLRKLIRDNYRQMEQSQERQVEPSQQEQPAAVL